MGLRPNPDKSSPSGLLLLLLLQLLLLSLKCLAGAATVLTTSSALGTPGTTMNMFSWGCRGVLGEGGGQRRHNKRSFETRD